MGILTKEVEVKITSNTVEYYKALGYEIPMKKATESTKKKYHKEYVYDFTKSIIVKVKDLQEESHAQIEVLCDYCKKNIIAIPYRDYKKRTKIINKYSCVDCSPLKLKESNLLMYNVESTSKLEEVKRRTAFTNIKKYGCIAPSQNNDVLMKMKETSLKRYSVDNYAKTQECQEKMKRTCKSRYGVEYSLQNEEILKKQQSTCIEKFGTPYPSQLPEIREKMSKTLYENSSQKCSCQQLYIYNLYNYNNQNNQVELNYPVRHYNVDICFPKEKLTIEYDGGFHDGQVKTGKLTQEEFDQKEIIRNNIIKREGYKQMRIISKKDLLPQDDILLQMLSETRQYFSDHPNHSWIEFHISDSIVRNAEHKDGIPYSFGSLRTIKDKEVI